MIARLLPSILLLVAPLALAAPAAPDPLPAEVARELRGLVADGRCDEVQERLPNLRSSYPASADLLVIEANCLLTEGRQTERLYDRERFERVQAGSGVDFLSPDQRAALYRQEVRFEPDLRERALDRFREALVLAPGRQDIVVGHVAVLFAVGETGEGLELLRRRAGELGGASVADLAALVEDELALERVEAAETLSAALVELFPRPPAVWRARAQAALGAGQLELARDAVGRLPHNAAHAPLQREVARRTLLRREWPEAVKLLASLPEPDGEALSWLAIARARAAPGSSLPIWKGLERQLTRLPARSPLRDLVRHHLRLARDAGTVTPEMHLHAARYFGDQRLEIAAIAEADAAVAAAPMLLDAWTFLVDLHRQAGRFELAAAVLDEAEQALRGQRGAGALASRRGAVLYALGEDENAWNALERAAAADAGAPYLQGLVALALGREARAIELLERAAAGTGPDAERAAAKLRAVQGEEPAQPTGAGSLSSP